MDADLTAAKRTDSTSSGSYDKRGSYTLKILGLVAELCLSEEGCDSELLIKTMIAG